MSVDVEEAIQRLAVARPGQRLLGHVELAVPIFRLSLDVLVEEQKPMPPVEEYVLRTVGLGISSLEDIGAFLGLEARLVEAAIQVLWQRDEVDFSEGEVRLTSAGQLAMNELCSRVPAREEVSIDFDRALFQVRGPASVRLMRPREIAERNLPELPLPYGHKKRPGIDDLHIEDVESAVKRSLTGRRSYLTLLAVRGVVRADRVFEHGLVLIYGDTQRNSLTYAIAVDGRLSAEHEEAFGRAGGAEALGIDVNELAASRPDLSELASNELVAAAAPEAEVLAAQRAADSLERDLRVTRVDEEADEQSVTALQEQLDAVRAQLDSFEVRRLQVYEHPPLLRDALEAAQHRLLIVSPWITSGVVDDDFRDRLSGACQRGVQVHIGFGISPTPGKPERRDSRAEDRLRSLAKRYQNFVFRNVGNTHAKILIKDDILVMTSFNWLSFRGDPRRTFRQEEGLLVKLPDEVDTAYENYRRQIELAG